MGMKIWMITVQFVVLLAAVRSFLLLRRLYERSMNRSQSEISDFSYLMHEVDFLSLLFRVTDSGKYSSQNTQLTDRTLQSLVTWVVGRVKRKLPRKEPLRNDFSQHISFTDASLRVLPHPCTCIQGGSNGPVIHSPNCDSHTWYDDFMRLVGMCADFYDTYIHQTTVGLMSFNGNFANISIDRLSTLQQDYLKSSARNRSMEFGYRIPQIETRDTAYELTGQIYGFEVHGRGFINVNITGLQINGTSRYSLNRRKHRSRIHLKQMKLNYWVDEIQIKVTGLEVPSIISDTINPLVSSIMTRYLQDQEENLSPRISETVRTVANERLKHSNVRRIMRFIWEWIL